MAVLDDRILLHLQDGRRLPVDPLEIYLFEARVENRACVEITGS